MTTAVRTEREGNAIVETWRGIGIQTRCMRRCRTALWCVFGHPSEILPVTICEETSDAS